jgi:hypothetical protein
MYRKFLFFSIVVVGIFFALAVFAQTCPHVYEGINCGANWYCNGCQSTCPTCPGGAPGPANATVLNYVNCTCNCAGGEIICGGLCTTPDTSCPADRNREDASTCPAQEGCGECLAGYSPNPAAPDVPNACIKAAYIDYANIGYFQISGDLKSTGGDLYLASGKALRIDGAGTTTLNIGNYTGTTLNMTLLGGFVVGAPTGGSKGAGTINAEQLCVQGSCRTTWPEAVNAFVDEGNVGFGPTAMLGTNDNVPLAFEINNSEKMRLTAGGNLGIGTTNPNARLEIYGGDLMLNGPFASSNVINFSADGTPRMALVRSASSNDLKIASFNAGIGEFVTFDYEAGNVGIGTTTPAIPLEVNGFIASNSASNALKTGSSGGDYSVAMYSNATTGFIQVANYAHTGGVRPLSLNPSGGNVGVGIVSPAYKLDVAGQINADTNATPAVRGRSSAADGYGGYFRADGTGNSYGVYSLGNGAGGYFRDLDSSGYTLVGFSNEGVLAYGSYAGVDANGGTYGVYASGTSYGGYFRMDSAGGYALFGQSFNANSWAGYFTGGKGVFTTQLCLGAEGNCRTDWPAGAAPGGANTNVQFNDSGNFGGEGTLTYNKTTDTLTVGGGGLLYVGGTIASGGEILDTNYGIRSMGPTAGGYFRDNLQSGYALVGYGDIGILAVGNDYAGYFFGGVYVSGGEVVGENLNVGGYSAAGGFIRAGTYLSVGASSSTDDDYIYFDDGSQSLKWNEGQTRFELSEDSIIYGLISATGDISSISGGSIQAYNNTNQMAIRIRHDGTNGIIEPSSTGVDYGNLVLQSNYAGRYVIAQDDFGVTGGAVVGSVANMGSGTLNAAQLCINGVCQGSWPSGTIGGSGTANYLAKFTAGTTIGNSLIFDNGTNVGIGTASPGAKLDINGNLKIGTLSGVLQASSGTVSGGATTSNLPEGSNLYYTDTRARNAISAGAGPVNYTPSTGVISFSGPLVTVYGGTGGTATPTAGAVAYGTGSAYAFTTAGSAGQFLQSNGTGAPTWATIPPGVSGSGTANYVAKFTGGTTVGNSQIIDNGTSVGIGSALSVSGDLSADGNTPSGCAWTSYAASVTCSNGQFVAGVRYSASTVSAYCCEL